MELSEVKKHFNSLSKADQWKWLIENKDNYEFVVMLDNDCTDISFTEDEDGDYSLTFKADCGDRQGVELLFAALGISAEGV